MTKQLPKAVIFGCEGPTLSSAERDFFTRVQPLGFILFLRNCNTPEQVKQLVTDLRSCVKHDYVPILIDQEGGRISRLNATHWRQYPAPSLFGQIAEEDMNLACWAVENNYYLVGTELYRLGINVDCAPLLDLNFTNAHEVIGDRAFHDSAEICSIMGYYAARGLQRAGIVPVIKHLPGHGRAQCDSHEELPSVSAALSDLQENDFSPFRNVCTQLAEDSFPPAWGMTAHIMYEEIDRDLPATLSPTIIEKIIRRHIGLKGFLVSDCITMKALHGDMGALAEGCLLAGCDAVLHCNGKLDEMISVASKVPELRGTSSDRLNASRIVSHHGIDPVLEEELWIELNYRLKPFWGGERRVT